MACDFDGVFTDATVYTDQNGIESVRCSRRDSLGVNMLKHASIGVIVISKETNPIVAVRCLKMGIPCYQGVDDGEAKLDVLLRATAIAGVSLLETAYIGDDVNDLEPLKAVGFAATVADGHACVMSIAHYVTKSKGGDHAVRELAEFILRAQKRPLAY